MNKHILIVAAAIVICLGSNAAAKQMLTIGAGNYQIDKDAAKFTEFRSVPKGLFLESYSINDTFGAWELDIKGEKVFRSDQSYNLKLSGPIDVTLNVDQIPHDLSHIAKTIFSHPTPTTFALPDDLQTFFQSNAAKTSFDTLIYTPTMATFASTAEGVILSTKRDKIEAKLKVGAEQVYGFDVAIEQEKKSGSKPIGAPLGFSQAVELPEPVDYATTNLKLHKNVILGAIEIDGSYKFTDFKNNVDFIQWDNTRRISDTTAASAYSTGNGSVTGKLDLYPSNKAHEAAVNIGSDLPLNGRFNGAIGYIRTTQNDNFVPYTTNTAIKLGAAGTPPFDASNIANLPAASLNGRIDTLVQQYLLNFNPTSFSRLLIKYNSANVDNKTASISFPGHVRMDQVWEVTSPESKNFGNKKDNYDVDLTFNLPRGWGLGAGYGVEVIDRNHREVEKTRENVMRVSLNGNLPMGILLNAMYLNGKRAMDEFHLDEYREHGLSTGTLIEHPGLRRQDVADRDRNEYNISLNASPKENIFVGLSFRNANHNFSKGKGDLTGGNVAFADNLYGLLSQKQDGIGLNTDIWLFDESVLFSTFADRSTIKYSERSNLTGGTITQATKDDWVANTTDAYDTIGFEITKYLADDRLTAGVSYWVSQGKGKIELSDITSTATVVESSPPDTVNLLSEFAVNARAKITDDLSLSGLLSFEDYIADDYAINNVRLISGKTAAGANSANAIFLGNSLVPYKASRVQIATTYIF